MRRLELLTGGLQIRFRHIAEFHIRSDCAQIQALAYTEYRQNMYLFIAVDVTVDVKMIQIGAVS